MSDPLITLEQAQEKYGPINSGIWEDESKHCTMIVVPAALGMVNTITGRPAIHIYCNADMAHPLLAVYEEIVALGIQDLLETFDGCLMVRDIRGEPGKVSTHSYALAVDHNAKKNPLGSNPTMDSRIVAVFKKHGFLWGGDFPRRDGMHFQLATW
jgi:hypothetical protein